MSNQPPVRISFGLVNAYLLHGEQGDVLVDTGLPGLGARLLWALRQQGSGPDRLALIILTHVHLDHVGNLQMLRRLTGAPLLVHRLEAPVLEAGRVAVPAGQTPLARLLMGMGRAVAPVMRLAPVRPDILVDDTFSLREFGIDGRVLHTPGHTRGSISVLLDSGDAIVGDLCQNGWGFGMGLGRIHLPLADVPEAIGPSWDHLLAYRMRRLFPGHGVPFDSETLRLARERLPGATGRPANNLRGQEGAVPMRRGLVEQFYTMLIYDEEYEYDAVIEALSEHLAANPSNAFAYNNRAVAYSERGPLQNALADFAEAIRLAPWAAEPVTNRGNLWLAEGAYASALADFDTAVRIAPDDPVLRRTRAYARWKAGNLPGALEDFTRAIELDPGFDTTYLDRATVLERLGEPERARLDRETAYRISGTPTELGLPKPRQVRDQRQDQ